MKLTAFDRSPHPQTGLTKRWRIHLDDGETLEWDGMCTGPRTLSEAQIRAVCRRLLGIEPEAVAEASREGLGPPKSPTSPRVLMHSTTPDLRGLDGDLDALRHGRRPLDVTAYKEARAPYLARPGDLALGRIRPWRDACVAAGVAMLAVPDTDSYYLSHALLGLAGAHERAEVPMPSALIRRFAAEPDTVAALYGFELELQIFLLWLRGKAGLPLLRTDANPPAVARAWNRKEVLHPTVEEALRITAPPTPSGPAWLEAEAARSALALALGEVAPVFPGYTLRRAGAAKATWIRAVLAAAALLGQRHGVARGCLKPSEAGDGARITLDIDLDDTARLTALAEQAHRHGDAYVLEPHVEYLSARLGDERVAATPSAHIRSGELAPGLTLQFTRGTSWKGNVYIDAGSASDFGLDAATYRRAREPIEALTAAFHAAGQGLVTAGYDLGIGVLGGPIWRDTVVMGVQDLNVSFTGAECLRAYMDRRAGGPTPAASRVVRPAPGVTVQALAEALEALAPESAEADVIAAVPDRWGMIALRGADATQAAGRVLALCAALLDRGLLLPL